MNMDSIIGKLQSNLDSVAITLIGVCFFYFLSRGNVLFNFILIIVILLIAIFILLVVVAHKINETEQSNQTVSSSTKPCAYFTKEFNSSKLEKFKKEQKNLN